MTERTWFTIMETKKTWNLAGVYLIENVKNMRRYVGQSSNVGQRLEIHANLLACLKHRCSGLQADYNDNGPASFRYRLLELVSDPMLRLMRERDHILTAPPETLYSKTIEQGRKLTEKQAARLREMAAHLPVNYQRLAELAGDEFGVKVARSTVWDVVHNATYRDADYSVPPHRLPRRRRNVLASA